MKTAKGLADAGQRAEIDRLWNDFVPEPTVDAFWMQRFFLAVFLLGNSHIPSIQKRPGLIATICSCRFSGARQYGSMYPVALGRHCQH